MLLEWTIVGCLEHLFSALNSIITNISLFNSNERFLKVTLLLPASNTLTCFSVSSAFRPMNKWHPFLHHVINWQRKWVFLLSERKTNNWPFILGQRWIPSFFNSTKWWHSIILFKVKRWILEDWTSIHSNCGVISAYDLFL